MVFGRYGSTIPEKRRFYQLERRITGGTPVPRAKLMSGAIVSGAAPRILIVKLSAVGDVVHALPVLNELRRRYPEAHLGWATHPGPANLLEGHPQLDELILLPRRRAQWKKAGGISRVLQRLRGSEGERWDWAIDLQGLTKSGLAAWLSRARRRVGFGGPDSRELNWLFLTDRVRPKSGQVIAKNLELLAPLGIAELAPPRAVLHTSEADGAMVLDWARRERLEDERFLVVDAFAGWPTKTWSRSRWVEVIAWAEREKGLRTLVFHGPGERHEAEALCGEANAAGARAVVAPETTLRQYVALLRAHGAAFAGGDTGPMHMAAAAGVACVALFGPSDPRRNSPVFEGARFEILQDRDQPCANTFNRRCVHHPEPGGCLATLSVEQVRGALERVISPGY